MQLFKSFSLKLTLLLFSIIVLSVGINSCKKDIVNGDKSVDTSNKPSPQKDIIQQINFKTFLSETNKIKSPKLSLLINKSPDAQALIRLNSTDSYSGLILFTDSIKKIERLGHTTYTFPVKQDNSSSISFQNFVIDVKDTAITTLLLTYTPDSLFLNNLANKKPCFFSGKVAAENFYSRPNTGIQVQALKPNLIQYCETVTVYQVYYTTCGGGQDHVYHTYAQGAICNGWGTADGAQRIETTYIFTTCELADIGGGGGGGSGGGGSGGGGSGGGGVYTPPTVPPGYNPCQPVVNPSSVGGKKVNLLPGGCPVTVPPVIPPIFRLTIKTDSLTKNFPCVTKLVINQLALDPNFSSWIAPFSSNRKPDIVWQNANLQWNVPNNAVTAGFTARLGETSTSASANDADRSAVISLNTNLLQKGSKLLIASVAIHETLHAFINYRLKTVVAGFTPPPQYSNTKSWIYALDSYSFTFGLPANYRDHNQMLFEYFDKSIGILKTYDNAAHTDKQYAMLMLYGLDTGDLLPLQGSLEQLYNATMLKYNITANDLRNYWVSQLNANANEKLPTTGCN